LPGLAAELVSLPVDVILANGRQAIHAAKDATATIPIVMIGSNPVDFGLVESLSRPGGNVAGMANLVHDQATFWGMTRWGSCGQP
jgi:putative ABC transport system substrate-binding protein